MGGAWPYVPFGASGEAPPQHIVAAARENLSTSPGSPACLEATPTGPSARQRCAAVPELVRLTCDAACVRRHLPDSAEQAHAGGLVAVRFNLDARGLIEHATSLNDPGCGLGRAAPEALRECCEPETYGGPPAQHAGVEGCHVVEFTHAR